MSEEARFPCVYGDGGYKECLSVTWHKHGVWATIEREREGEGMPGVWLSLPELKRLHSFVGDAIGIIEEESA